MEDKEEDIDWAIAKVLAKEADIEDILLINGWLDQNQENKEKLMFLKSCWKTIPKAQDGIVSEIAYEKFEKQLKTKEFQRFKISHLYYVVASIILLSISGIAYNSLKKAGKSVQYFTYISKDNVTQTVLEDGTIVYLGKNSKLTYSDKYDEKERFVKLDGEAYFDVTKTGTEFIVDMDEAQIKVLGTKFNVNAYSGNSIMIVTLEEGSVCFTDNKQKVVLRPDNELIYNKKDKKIRINNVETILNTAWKDGIFKYSGITLDELCASLQKIYQVNIELSPKLKNIKVSGSFKYDLTIEQVLNIIQKSLPLNWSRNGNVIVIRYYTG